MHYEGNIIRPPSEANSILLQVSVGCSRNKCTFCGTYTGERFRIKPDSIIIRLQIESEPISSSALVRPCWVKGANGERSSRSIVANDFVIRERRTDTEIMA